jgi:1,4-alpha-glucan branching enzyme
MKQDQTNAFLTDYELYLFGEGTYYRAWEKMGAHEIEVNGVTGTRFAVWAPNAEYVSVVGDFNNWDELANPLSCRGNSGVWEGFIPGVRSGNLYKYAIRSRYNGYRVWKADPFAFYAETPPKTASIVWNLSGYEWHDEEWMATRHLRNHHEAPIAIYEVHLGSWRKGLSYRELAHQLAEYVSSMGFTHVEFLPPMEHPFAGSWGYQVTGYFAPTSRFGTPQDFMYLVDVLHQHNIGVIIDWVPAHFPRDEHGLGYFDGTHLYEHADPRKGIHPDWNTFIFNYGRNEVRSFLLSNALFWCEVYHVDGLRVDAVASMLYLDYSRKDGEWIPNQFGGRENLEAIDFLKKFNELLYGNCHGIMTIAEESTAWPMVSRPTYIGGLGFGFKWNMGWMHDTLLYMSKDPIHRKYHHNNLTFSLLYAFHENFILPFSHDEVTHGKGSLIGKMPGDYWQKFANLRVLYGYMYAHPGKKLLFMGAELAQWNEWNHDAELDWILLDFPSHRGVQLWLKDLNNLLKQEPALYELDGSYEGFRWIDCNDSDQSTLSFLRIAKNREDIILCVFNFTPVPRDPFIVGVPKKGFWRELLNSDSSYYGGSNMGNGGGLMAQEVPWHGLPYSLKMTLPPLSASFFKAPQ